MTSQLPLFVKRAPAPRRNLVIEAGAGTGKTTAIVAEVLKLMLDDEELAPERIVLVTFTEKAAGEIADRIHDALHELDARFDDEQLVWPAGSPNPLLVVPDDKRSAWQRACAKQLGRIDSLRSQTIHSFCQSLLRQFPIEAGLDPQFKIIEGFERSLLHGQLYDAWVDEETRLHPKPERIGEWEFLLRHTGYLFMIRDAIFQLVDRRDLLAETGYDTGGIGDMEEKWLAALHAVTDGPIARWVEAHPPRHRSIDEWIDYFEPIAGEIRSRDLPRGRAGETTAAALKILRGTEKKGDSIYDLLVSHRAALALLSLARRFVAFLDVEKRKLGVVDFDDLLLRTLAMLDDAPTLERIRRQIDYLFVDEFQDTDRTQARIFDRLARDRDGNYVAGKTIVVGDPKQSIYGFRRADPETYDAMTHALIEGGAEHRVIADQYRSDPPLLDDINSLFTILFPEVARDVNVFRPKYHALRAGRASSSRELDARITFLHSEHDEKNDRHFAEAEAIAEWIRSRGDDLRRFAILFRRLTKIDDYLDTFDRYGIDYVLPPTRLFLDRRAPVDLIAVLRAIGYPFDHGAAISAARTPYFALTDEEIVQGVIASDDGAWCRFRETLDVYRAQAHQLTVSQLIDRLIATSNIESVYDAAADGERSKRHLEHVRAIAFEYDRKIGGSVRQFVDEIARRRAEPDEVEPSLLDDSRNAVRILTVHGAKGLEFETVILPDLVFPIKGPEIFLTEEPQALVMRGQHETLNARTLGDIGSDREAAEMRRLFYVAVTRAKCDVAFVCNTSSFAKMGFFSCLAEAFGFTKDTFATLWCADAPLNRTIRTIRTLNGMPVAFEKMSTRGAGVRTRRRLLDPAVESELANGDILPLSLAAPPSIDNAKIPIRRDRTTGILLHRVLELADGDPLAILDAAAAELGASHDAVARVKARLRTIAHSATFKRIAKAETIGRELPIRIDGGDLRVDRLVREKGRELVIDYKSGIPSDEHKLQVRTYCDAVARMTGRPCAGLIWYIDEESDHAVDMFPSPREGGERG
ncbi:MAG TPA: UvrD-helicase domain-containing protein [Thermoanaerobaculia bacterium]|nr:UvrD-helicase domain-containing protein [Thermoanaerobaculia bacterium]